MKPDFKDKRGYIKVWYEGKYVWKHRLVWFQNHGYWPEIIDHVDDDKSNNDISNLREVTKGQNNHYRPVRKDSSTGVKGVFPNGSGFMARIAIDGKPKYLGTFKTVEEAQRVYNKEAKRLYG